MPEVLSWDISNSSSNSAFQFGEEMWIILINHPSGSRTNNNQSQGFEVWKIRMPQHAGYKPFAEYLLYGSH